MDSQADQQVQDHWLWRVVLLSFAAGMLCMAVAILLGIATPGIATPEGYAPQATQHHDTAAVSNPRMAAPDRTEGGALQRASD